MIVNKTIEEWQEEFPLIRKLIKYEETVWMNDHLTHTEQILPKLSLDEADILAAEARLKRFAPYISHVFPETAASAGIIESPLSEISKMKESLQALYETEDFGALYLKEDNKLPISGSIKARGGIYEMLAHAESLALEANMISVNEDYQMFAHETFKEYFSQYSVVCGSTGNLGLSIGIIGAELGFNVTIHMSDDARQWKKDMLREKGVTVVEHSDDYSKAVEEGRRQSAMNSKSHFIDDENSTTLFLGYAVAAIRLKTQLENENILVGKDDPLHVYLPCGVGGGPGGIAFGLKTIFGNNVHCYFAEPTHSPSMLLGMMTDYHETLAVQDFGIDNITAADGLAVGRPSGFVGQFLRELITGAYTVSDENFFKMLTVMYDSEGIKLEPSALAGVIGPIVTKTKGTHIAWSTGGDMVPEDVWKEYYQTGKEMI